VAKRNKAALFVHKPCIIVCLFLSHTSHGFIFKLLWEGTKNCLFYVCTVIEPWHANKLGQRV